MGFQDFAEEIRSEKARQEKDVKAKKRKYVGNSPVAKENMDFQADRLEVINDARDIAKWIYGKVGDRLDTDTQTQKEVATLVAKALILQPQELPDDWPTDVKTEAERASFIKRFIMKQIINAASRLTTDLVSTAYDTEKVAAFMREPGSDAAKAFTKEVSYIREKALRYVSKMQQDGEMGQSGFLGDALALTFVRDSRIRSGGKDGSLENQIRERAADFGVNLDNSISRDVTFKGRDGKDVKVRINDGSLVEEYSAGTEAAQIGFAGRTAKKHTIKAWLSGALGHAPNVLVQHLAENANPKSLLGRMAIAAGNWDLFNSGRSHAGNAFVDSDQALDLHHVKIYDMYVDAERGGQRITTPKSFALNGPFRRISVSDHDPKKLAALFLEQTDPNQKEAPKWVSHLGVMVEGDLEESKRTVSWPKLAADPEITEMRRLAQENPEKFANEYHRHTRKGWNYLRNNGTVFDYGFTNLFGGAYCSKGCVLAPMIALGVDIETQHSRWAFPLELISKFKKEGLEPVKRGGRFVAPVNLEFQETIGRREVVDFPHMDDMSRRLARTEPFISHSDDGMRRLLNKIPWRLGEKEDSSFMSDLEGEVAENVARRNLGSQKMGPSKMFASSQYARQAMGGKFSYSEKEAPKGEEKKTVYYSRKVGSGTVESHYSGEDREKDIRDFLANEMGFDYYVDKAKARLESGDYKNELNRITLEGNVRRYTMVDDARELAAHIVSRAIPNLKDAEFRERYAHFVADMLNIKPEAAVKEVPMVVRSHPDLIKRAESIEKYFEKAERFRGRMQLERLVSDYLYTFYGEKYLNDHLSPESETKQRSAKQRANYERNKTAINADIAKMTNLFGDYLFRVHLDPHIGDTQWAGRAVAVATARHARLNGDPDLEKICAKEVRRRGQHWKNFTSDTLKMRDSAGKLQSIRVATGDYAYGRGTAAESAVITSAAVPKDLKAAKKERLTGNIAGFIIPVSEKAMTDGLSPIERLRYTVSSIDTGNPGFSHVGTFDVRRAKDKRLKGLASTWVRDNYPHANDAEQLAGVRISGVENFGNENHYGFLGVARLDMDKLHQFAMAYAESLKDKEWNDLAWRAYKPKVDENGKVIPDAEPERGDWKIIPTKDEFIAMHSEKDPRKWKRMARKKIREGWDLLQDWGTYFSWVDNGAGKAKIEVRDKDGKVRIVEKFTPGKYYEGGSYCSQGCFLAPMMTMGLPMEEPGNEGDFANFVKFLHLFVPLPAIQDLDIKERILPPSSLAMQKWIQIGKDGKRVRRVSYAVQGLEGRQKAEESAPDVEQALEITMMLRNSETFNRVLEAKGKMKIDPKDREWSIHESMKRAAIRAVTEGASVEDVIGIDPGKLEELRAEAKKAGKVESSASFGESVLEKCQKGAAKVARAARAAAKKLE